eukprot:m.80035 g.80035  ORF g.80035 m.80035 type:complete len:505 (+) comp14817_c0_seq1:208-1722(+)
MYTIRRKENRLLSRPDLMLMKNDTMCLSKAQEAMILSWQAIGELSTATKHSHMQMRMADGSWEDVFVELFADRLIIKALQNKMRIPRLMGDTAARTVVIEKMAGEALGISITGGADYGMPVLISSVREGSPAAMTRSLLLGDELLQVDMVPCSGLVHVDAVTVLTEARERTQVKFVVRQREDFLDMEEEESVDDYGWKKIKTIPLAFAYAEWSNSHLSSAQKDKMHDSFTVRSATNIFMAATLRMPGGDRRVMAEWLQAITQARFNIPIPMMRKSPYPEGFTGLVLCLKRVHEKLESGNWRDLFVAVTDYDFNLYTSLPLTTSDLKVPLVSVPLLAVRYRSGILKSRTTRVGVHSRELVEGMCSVRTPNGECYYFSAGTLADEKSLARIVRERVSAAVKTTESVTYPARLNNEDVALTLNVNTGMWLHHDSRGDKSLMWHHPFSHLKQTEEDREASVLHLEFGGEGGGIVPLALENSSIVTFVLFNFMAAQLDKAAQPTNCVEC